MISRYNKSLNMSVPVDDSDYDNDKPFETSKAVDGCFTAEELKAILKALLYW